MIPKLRILFIGILCVTAMGCVQSNDPESVLNDYFDIMETFINKMEKPDKAGEVADAMNTFSGQMKALIPRIASMKKQYPDIKNLKDGVPEKYRALSEKNEQLARKFVAAMSQTLAYMEDPRVKRAQKRFEKVLGQML